MIHAVLADDEAVILKGLKKLIDWKKLQIEIVGEAKDGQEALAVIREKQPELVISDIAMPKLDGLAMLKTMKEEGILAKVIFVSGYQEFAYARDAVKHGAVDYLLKPVEQEELEHAVCKALALIDEQSRLDLLATSDHEDKVYQIFQKINGGQEYAKEDLYEQFASRNLDVNGKCFLGVVFRIHSLKGMQGNSKMQELLKFAVYNKIQKYMEEQKWGFVVRKDRNTCSVILLLENRDCRKQVEARIRKLIQESDQNHQVGIKVGIGELVEEIQYLHLAYKTSRFAQELYYFTEEDVIWYEDVNKEFKESFGDYQESYGVLVQAMRKQQKNIQVETNRILSVIRSLHYGSRFAAVNRLNLLASELTQELIRTYLLSETYLEKQEQLMEQLRLMPTYRQACETMIAYLGALQQETLNGGTEEYNESVRIRQYIAAHFRENLTLDTMAQVVGMNSFYFSSYFKKNVGENFKNYLTNVRMEEAGNLLLHTDYKAYEVAELVGYKNVRQFNENFKGKYGKSPNEFRKEK